jgi:hypothetical protein
MNGSPALIQPFCSSGALNPESALFFGDVVHLAHFFRLRQSNLPSEQCAGSSVLKAVAESERSD